MAEPNHTSFELRLAGNERWLSSPKLKILSIKQNKQKEEKMVMTNHINYEHPYTIVGISLLWSNLFLYSKQGQVGYTVFSPSWSKAWCTPRCTLKTKSNWVCKVDKRLEVQKKLISKTQTKKRLHKLLQEWCSKSMSNLIHHQICLRTLNAVKNAEHQILYHILETADGQKSS